MNAIGRITTGLMLSGMAVAAGCGNTDSTSATPPNSGTGATGMGTSADVTGPARFGNIAPGEGAGGAPSYGAAMGNGFHTGDSDQSGGMGSGLEGFHGLGAAGTSGAITDTSAPVDADEMGTARTAAHS